MPLQLHRPPRQPRPAPSRSNSGPEAPTTMAPPDDCNASVYSFLSSSEHTAVSSDHHQKDLPALPKYSYDLERDHSIASMATKLASEYDYGYSTKKLDNTQPPSWALSQAAARGAAGDPSPSCQRYTAPSLAQSRIQLTSSDDLSAALGADNTPYHTEIDVLPCAGVRIPYGSLTGQLAWRMVVHAPLRSKDKHWWSPNGSNLPAQEEPCECDNCKRERSEAREAAWTARRSSEHRPRSAHFSSSLSLPLDNHPTGASSSVCANSAQPRTAHLPTLPRLVVNFILDSTLPHSIISRETLIALGVREASFPGADYDPHGEDADDDERRGDDVLDARTQLVLHRSKGKHHGPDRKGVVTGVTLSVQGVRTRVRVAREGEASRLGVQFLKDASASLMFPGDGVGPVLYLESMGAVRDAPRTVTGLSRWKNLTLPQRVRLILGLAPSSS